MNNIETQMSSANIHGPYEKGKINRDIKWMVECETSDINPRFYEDPLRLLVNNIE